MCICDVTFDWYFKYFHGKIVLKPILNLTKFSLSFLAAKYVIYAKESLVMTETHHWRIITNISHPTHSVEM